MKTSKISMFAIIASAFDPAALLHASLKTEDIATTFVPVPEGDHAIQFKAPKIESGEKNGKVWARLECPVTITDPNVAQEMGIDPSQDLGSTYTLFLDIDQESKQLAFGVNKNIRLGQLFEALGMHGEEASISEIEGKTAIANFKHRKTQNDNVVSEITRIFEAE